jgi:GABA(A) receptor-associated protein
MEYRNKFTIEHRKKEVNMLLSKYPDRVPIYIENPKNETIVSKHKFLVPADITFFNFISIVRKETIIKSYEGLYFFVSNNLVPSNLLLSEIYNTYKDEDGMLYLKIFKEASFGYN